MLQEVILFPQAWHKGMLGWVPAAAGEDVLWVSRLKTS